MHHFFSLVAYTFLTFAAWTAMGNPSRYCYHARSLGTAGIVVGVGNGKGALTFQGNTYSFEVSRASFGATLTRTASELEGRALNLHSPEDLAGNYIAVGAGGAIVGGAGVARLRNAGVTLAVRGPKLGMGLSVNLARVTITMM